MHLYPRGGPYFAHKRGPLHPHHWEGASPQTALCEPRLRCGPKGPGTGCARRSSLHGTHKRQRPVGLTEEARGAGQGGPPDSLGRTAKRTNGKAEPSSHAQGQDGCRPALTGHSPEAPRAWAGSGAQRGLTPASATRLEMAEAVLLRQVPGRMPPAGMPTHFTWRRSSKKKQLWKRNHGPRGKRHALNIVTLMKTSH